MFTKLGTSIMAVAAIVLSGCIEKKREVTLNPDGSGKMIFEIKQPLDIMGGMKFGNNAPAKEESPAEKAKKQVSKFLKSSKGIDAWEDVSYNIEEDGALRFKGTLYFKNFNDVKITGGQMGGASKVKVDKNGITVSLTQKKNSGRMTNQTPKLTEKELDAKVTQMQAQMKQQTAMMGAMLSGLKDETIFHLPGKIDKFNNFKKVDDNTVSVSIDGEKIMKVMQAFSKDKEALKKAVKDGENGPGEEFMNKNVFGNSGDVTAHVSNMKTQFDYKKAVEKAKNNFSAMCKKLGVEPK